MPSAPHHRGAPVVICAPICSPKGRLAAKQMEMCRMCCLALLSIGLLLPTAAAFSTASNGGGGGASPRAPDVLCVGETLWDSLPSGIFLGGAPSNVAVHLASLFGASSSKAKPTVAIAACLGDDQLGREAQRRLAIKGVRTDHLQFHPEWETGMATAIIGEAGDATYEFITPAAWDGLCLEEKMTGSLGDGDGALSTKVYIMGTIAARLEGEYGATSADTLRTIRNGAPEGSVVLDVNLRSPWYSPEAVVNLVRGEAIGVDEMVPKQLALLKLNEEELPLLEEWCGLTPPTSNAKYAVEGLTGSILKDRMDQLATSLNTQRVCVTRGKDGAALFCKGNNGNGDAFYENGGYRLTVDKGSDTVGAGDAFVAALVNSLFVCNEPPERALERACALGGYVAGCRGATPEHRDAPDELRRIFSDIDER